jgi:arsenate reductase-like glutaredoxin family protein
LELIINSNIKYKVINYLEDDIRFAELEALVKGLIDPLEELVRTNDLNIKNKKINFENKEDIINLLINNKNCLQRPIVGVEGIFEICRPVDKVLKYLDKKIDSK